MHLVSLKLVNQVQLNAYLYFLMILFAFYLIKVTIYIRHQAQIKPEITGARIAAKTMQTDKEYAIPGLKYDTAYRRLFTPIQFITKFALGYKFQHK